MNPFTYQLGFKKHCCIKHDGNFCHYSGVYNGYCEDLMYITPGKEKEFKIKKEGSRMGTIDSNGGDLTLRLIPELWLGDSCDQHSNCGNNCDNKLNVDGCDLKEWPRRGFSTTISKLKRNINYSLIS